jgi:hypothetical protein
MKSLLYVVALMAIVAAVTTVAAGSSSRPMVPASDSGPCCLR